MKKTLQILAILMCTILLSSVTCNDKDGQGCNLVLSIEPKIGLTSTDIYFSAVGLGDCDDAFFNWEITDPDGEKVDLGPYYREGTILTRSFEKIGEYVAKLNGCCSAMGTFRIVDHYGEEPVAVLNVDPEEGDTSTTFIFDASDSYDFQTPMDELQVRWDMTSDGIWDVEYSIQKIYEKTFNDPGEYKVSVQVKDTDGNESDVVDKRVKVAYVTGAPEAIFDIEPEYGTTVTDFVFDASESWDLNTPKEALLFSWDFENDGTWEITSSSEVVTEHRYNEEGEFVVKLKVEDEDGLFDFMTESVPVINCINGGDPCFGVPTVEYMGKTYNTVQIGDQCWMKENLNVGTLILSNDDPTDNDVIEKYCYNDDESYCTTYGALYQWSEAMEYADGPGGQGICPEGWHIPKAEEWDLLAVYLNGYDLAGMLMKSCTEDWLQHPNHINTNESGFTGLPGGLRPFDGTFVGISTGVGYWTSTTDENYSHRAYYRALSYDYDRLIGHNSATGLEKKDAYYIRCIKDSD